MSAMYNTYQDGILTYFLCEFFHSNTMLELNICACSEARVGTLLISAGTNLLTACEEMLILQHMALTLNKSEWFVHLHFFYHYCCNVLVSQNEHPSTEAYTSRTLFFYTFYL